MKYWFNCFSHLLDTKYLMKMLAIAIIIIIIKCSLNILSRMLIEITHANVLIFQMKKYLYF